jgi:hypothetical protein
MINILNSSHQPRSPDPDVTRAVFADINKTLLKHDLNCDQVLDVLSLAVASLIKHCDPGDTTRIMVQLIRRVKAALTGGPDQGPRTFDRRH